MTITFRVSNVERATAPLRMRDQEVPHALLGRPVEAWGCGAPLVFPAHDHGLLRAVQWAFAAHYPLVLTPDAVWLCIAQGFATHVNADASRLRDTLVRHEGRVRIAIRRDDFRKGSPENPWPEVFQAFSEGIAAHLGPQRDLVVCDFSTTGPCERAASEIVLMDAMKQLFDYSFLTMCGIPEITLEGTVDDWRSIRHRAEALREYELGWWVSGLAPVLDQLVAAAEGRVDVGFWESLFKLSNGSGGPYVTGWINVLFPYLRAGKNGALQPNKSVTTWAQGMGDPFGGGPKHSSIPVGLSLAPFEWKHLEQSFPMELLGGFVGVAQDAGTLALRPAIGWAVRDADELTPRLAIPSVSAGEARGVAVIAGRISRGQAFTLEETLHIAERVAAIGERLGIPLQSVLLDGAPPPIPYTPIAARLVIGVPRAAAGVFENRFLPIESLSQTLASATALSESTWDEIAALVPGGLAPTSAVHFVCYGDNCRGTFVFGAMTDDVGRDPASPWLHSNGHRMGLRGVTLAEVSALGPRHVVLDASAEAHEANARASLAAGIKAGAGRYYPMARRF